MEPRVKRTYYQPSVFKFGCNWRGCTHSFYDFIRERGIVLGREQRTPYSIGDLVLITEGFKVKAIAKVLSEPLPITAIPEYKSITANYWVDYEPSTTIAEADWYQLKASEVFEYKVQRGAARVRKTQVMEKTIGLWDNR